jgi:3-(3-hydroxy-phenyl)propionate hydroxylase
MAPPSAPFRLMRDAVLSLAEHHPWVAQLANPRQHSAIPLVHSCLNAFPERSDQFAAGPAPGEILPECPVLDDGRSTWLTRLLGAHFTILWFGEAARAPQPTTRLPLVVRSLPRSSDPSGHLYAKFGATEDTLYLVRPDGHVLARWRNAVESEVSLALARVQELPCPVIPGALRSQAARPPA